MRILNASLFTLVLLLLWCGHAAAHELRPGYLELTETTPATYRAVWKNPIRLGKPLAVELGFPDDCAASDVSTRGNENSVALISRFTLKCEQPLQDRSVEFIGLDATLTDILVRFQPADDDMQTLRATADKPTITIAKKASRLGVAKTYFVLGVEHIWFGIDHLLFVLALVLLITGVKRLVETITAFTIAHSITLVGTSLGWFSLPGPPVEAVIALSIVFLASELANKRAGTERLSERYPWVVAFAFGLLHGFGFAGALANIGLPSGELPVALLTFNLGVEAGQLVFVAAVLLVLALFKNPKHRHWLDVTASYAIGVTATLWLIERVW